MTLNPHTLALEEQYMYRVQSLGSVPEPIITSFLAWRSILAIKLATKSARTYDLIAVRG